MQRLVRQITTPAVSSLKRVQSPPAAVDHQTNATEIYQQTPLNVNVAAIPMLVV